MSIVKEFITYAVMLCIIVGSSYCLGWYFCNKELQPTIQSLQEQVAVYKAMDSDKTVGTNTTHTEISYQPKASQTDSDVELNTADKLKVTVNGKVYSVAKTDQKTGQKIENGKIHIYNEETYKFDMSQAVNEVANERIKRARRAGYTDFGLLYNGKENDTYAGLRFNTKAWDAGYYHNVSDDDWLIGFHYHW